MEMIYRPRLYLGGAMRNGILADYVWRKDAWEHLEDLWTIIDPCWGKTYHGKTDVPNRTAFDKVESQWRFCGTWVPNDRVIYRQDRHDVQNCDAGVWNFSALCDGYPCIGSTTEVAWADAWNKLVYIIYPEPDQLHPFLKGSATEIFPSTEEAINYLVCYAGKLCGKHYDLPVVQEVAN